MKVCTVRTIFVIGGLLGAISVFAANIFAAETGFTIPNEPGPIRLNLNVRIDDQPAEAVWATFIDKWFDFFDRDADGILADSELIRVLPLPLLERKTVSLDVKLFDANGDGQGSRDEIKAFYQQSGFTPIVTVTRPPAEAAIRLSEILFLELDRDRNGSLTKIELERAAKLLSRFDEDEDEVLTVAELLALPVRDQLLAGQTFDPTAAADVLGTANFSIEFASLPKSNSSTANTDQPGQIEIISPPEVNPLRLRLGKNFCAVIVETNGPQQAFKSARSFYLAQFKTTFGASSPVTRQQLGQDPTLALIGEQFDVAERNGDGKLGVDELTTFLTLIEQGIGAQTVATLNCQGRSLFEMLDRDHDGRLVVSELHGAAQLVMSDQAQTGITREQIPIQFQLHVERGTPGATFGPIPIPNRPLRSALPVASKTASGPRWFQSLDKNSDGSVSPQEFPGTAELFRQLDRDQDGLISTQEAETAKAPDAK